MSVRLIGLDADDTLWHCETIFRSVQERFRALLADYAEAAEAETRLDAVERRNLRLYGYGAKGFTLSMLEAALEVSGGTLSASAVSELLALGRSMMSHPIEPLPGVIEAIATLAALDQPLVLITKGDMVHQEAKLAASGLGRFFSGVEIVSEKDPDTYRRVFARYQVAPQDAVMVGNSIRSDILPVLEIGGYAALVPYPVVWAHESAVVPIDHPRFHECATLADLPAWLAALG